MIIDFHTHTFPARVAEKAIIGMQAASHASAFSDGTAAGLQSSMAKTVDICVVLPVATNPLKLVSMNDASIAENGKNGLVYFGAMHPMAENWREELNRIANAGIKGIKIHPHYQNTDIDDVRYLRILERAAELGLITVMHAGWDIGFPGVLRCSPPMIRNALQQVGRIPIVLAHMGGWKNWDQVYDELADTGCYIDTALSIGKIAPLEQGYYTEEARKLLSPEDFCNLVNRFGAQRVLFGTDSPWASQQEEIEKLMATALTREQKDRILYQNAKQLLNI